MARFFSSENWFWKPFGYVADVFILSALWFIFSVPLVTMGASTAAAYDCAARCIRGSDRSMFARFFRTGKREFFPALLSMLLWALLIWGSYQLAKLYGNAAPVGKGSTLITAALLFLTTIVVGVFTWVLPLLSRFTFSFFNLQITAVKLAFGHILRTILLGVITVLAAYLCIQYWVPFLIVPGLLAVLWSLIMEPVFRQYMPQQDSGE
ncbi:MAG: DUF624 domain-containing protein [Candidatus Limivicinus sp.]|jgi:uncharacterized membrane protein YesL